MSVDSSATLETDPIGFCDADFTTESIGCAVNSLKTGKAVGWDNIPNEAIIHAGHAFLLMLTMLFNMIKSVKKVPYGWNRLRLVLVHKKGAIEDFYNYRPLNVIISLCRVFSKVLNDRLSAVCEMYHPPYQEVL